MAYVEDGGTTLSERKMGREDAAFGTSTAGCGVICETGGSVEDWRFQSGDSFSDVRRPNDGQESWLEEGNGPEAATICGVG